MGRERGSLLLTVCSTLQTNADSALGLMLIILGDVLLQVTSTCLSMFVKGSCCRRAVPQTCNMSSILLQVTL